MLLHNEPLFFFILNVAYLLIYSLSATGVFYKLKVKLDRSSIITILVYWASDIVKFVNWLIIIVDGTKRIMDYFVFPDIVATFLVIIITYYFAFEMRTVHNTLESQNP